MAVRQSSIERSPGAFPVADSSVDVDLEAFVVEHYDRLLRLARLICRDASDATDAVQIGLEHAWRRRSSLRDPERHRAWLDRIVVREAIRITRRHRSLFQRVFGFDQDVDWIEPSVRAPDHDVELRVALRDAFETLSPEQRAVVALHLYAGHSVAETATIVGAPLETVRSRLRLARERLRHALEEAIP
jgi:RNA polymerase sigma-70 factor, ECF subfamily